MWEWAGNEASHVAVCQEYMSSEIGRYLSVHVTICGDYNYVFELFMCAGGKFPIVAAGTGRYAVSSLVPRPSHRPVLDRLLAYCK